MFCMLVSLIHYSDEMLALTAGLQNFSSKRCFCNHKSFPPQMFCHIWHTFVYMHIAKLYSLYTHVHMQRLGIFKRRQRGSAGMHLCPCQFTVSEVKIVFVLLYWLLLTILIWSSFSVRAGRAEEFDYHLRSYIDCMAGGDRRDHDCQDLRRDLEADIQPVVEVTYLVLVAFLNFSSLPFVIQFQTVKHSVRQITQRLSSHNTISKHSIAIWQCYIFLCM